MARALDVPLDWLGGGVGLPPEPAAKRTQRIAEERRSRLRQVLEGVEDSRKAVEILKSKGFDVTYLESEVGHNWTAWKDRLADAFIGIWK